jgi:hypothetical protein
MAQPSRRASNARHATVCSADLADHRSLRPGQQPPQDLALQRRANVAGPIDQPKQADNRIEQIVGQFVHRHPGIGRRRARRAGLKQQSGDGFRLQCQTKAQERRGAGCLHDMGIDRKDDILAGTIGQTAFRNIHALCALSDDGKDRVDNMEARRRGRAHRAQDDVRHERQRSGIGVGMPRDQGLQLVEHDRVHAAILPRAAGIVACGSAGLW